MDRQVNVPFVICSCIIIYLFKIPIDIDQSHNKMQYYNKEWIIELILSCPGHGGVVSSIQVDPSQRIMYFILPFVLIYLKRCEDQEQQEIIMGDGLREVQQQFQNSDAA